MALAGCDVQPTETAGSTPAPPATHAVATPIAAPETTIQPVEHPSERIAKEGIYTQEDFDRLLGKSHNGEMREFKLKELVQGGDSKAMLTYGLMRSRDNDFGGALEYFRKAATAGNRRAVFNLGMAYYAGLGVEKDKVRAFQYYQDAAEKGDAYGQFEVGRCMEEGDGTAQSSAALEFYLRAARQGYGRAQIRLGEIKRDAGNRSEALHWFRMAADQEERESFPNLGSLLVSPSASKLELAEGIRSLKRAGELNHGWALWWLGEIHLHGDFNESQDPALAFSYFTRSHQAGYPGGTGLLGFCHFYGIGTTRNPAKAFQLYSIAHTAGVENATIGLALCYDEGLGTMRNHRKSVELLLPIAKKGNSYAQYNLYWALRHAAEAEKSAVQAEGETEARIWLKRASDQGFEPARKLLRQLSIEGPARTFRDAGREALEEQSKYLRGTSRK